MDFGVFALFETPRLKCFCIQKFKSKIMTKMKIIHTKFLLFFHFVRFNARGIGRNIIRSQL